MSAVAAGALIVSGLVAGTAPAHAAPTPPLFVRAIDGYAAYDGQQTCSDHVQPGVLELETLLLSAYPGTYNASDLRGCSGGVSEHKDGRAFDWGIPDGYQGKAEELLAWLLHTDAYGNPDALLRRLGLMYVIWNRQIFEAWDADAGWQPYDGYDPHTSHVHFSFSWDGALEKTSWFTGGEQGLLLDQAGYGASWRDKHRLDVVRLGADGDIQQRTYADRTWDSWHSLGGSVVSAPSGGWTSDRSYWVFGLGAEGKVVYRRWKADSGWSTWRDLGRDATSGVDVSASHGRIDLVTRGADGNVLYRQWLSNKKRQTVGAPTGHGGWSPWEDAGGFVTAAPAITRRGQSVDVFVRGGTGLVHESSRLGRDDWTAWVRVSGATTSGPTATATHKATSSLFVRGTAGDALDGEYGDGAWAWGSIGGDLSSAPTADAASKRRLDVLVRGNDGRLWMKTWKKRSGWSSWGAQDRGVGRVETAPNPLEPGDGADPAITRSHEAELQEWPVRCEQPVEIGPTIAAVADSEQGPEYTRTSATATYRSDTAAEVAATELVAALRTCGAVESGGSTAASTTLERRVPDPTGGGAFVTTYDVQPQGGARVALAVSGYHAVTP